MKFLQIATFYDHYIANFYKRYPQHFNNSFEKQIDALIQDGFGASHIIAPHLTAHGHESHLVVANCAPMQGQWMRERGIRLKDKNNWVPEILKMQVEVLKPDVLYTIDPITFDSRFIRSLSVRPKMVMGWRAASIPQNTDWTEFDLILSNHPPSLERALQLGAKSVRFYFPGFPGFISNSLKDEPKMWDVMFTGQVSPEHTQRIGYLKEVAKTPMGIGGDFSVAYFLSSMAPSQLNSMPAGIVMNNKGERWGMDMYRELRRGSIVLNIDIDIGTGGNLRLFETTGVGSFLLTEGRKDVKRYFEPGSEIEIFHNKEELIEKIYYYLSHPEEREEIAKQGHKRCIRDYSMKTRAAEFDDIVRDVFKQKRGSIRPQDQNHTAKTIVNSIEDTFSNVTFGNHVQIIGVRNVSIGEGSCIADDVWLNVCIQDRQKRLTIGKCVLIGRRSTISTAGILEIGDYTILAPNVYVSDANHDYDDIMLPILFKGVTRDRSIRIEENCWLCTNCVISGDLIVGRGSIVGANAVVLTDVPPFSVIVGNPGRIVKMFDPVKNAWIRIKTDEHKKKVIENRQRRPLPSRQEYAQILARSGMKQVPSIVAGKGEHF
jgi:acetyltransferase-like isoleucine patch superfamily enzyme